MDWKDCISSTDLIGATTPTLKGKATPLQALTGPEGSRRLRLPDFLRQSAHEGGRVVSPTHRPPLPPGNIPGTHFCNRLSRPQGHSAAGRIMSMKNSNDTIGKWPRDLPVCSAVPQPLRHRVPPLHRLCLEESKKNTQKSHNGQYRCEYSNHAPSDYKSEPICTANTANVVL
jgi:hypothetical protein